MLDSQLHSNLSSLVWQIAIPRSLILLILLHFISLNDAGIAAQELQNITIPVTSPDITYTPFFCNASTVLANPEQCAGAWQLSNTSEVMSITGPTSGIIPQLFFQFQASILYINTDSLFSNASVNLTISADGRNVTTVFDSSAGVVSIVDLPQNQTVSVTIIFISSTGPTIFVLESFIISIPADSTFNTSTSLSFPTPTLPSSASLPTVIPTSSNFSVVTTPTAVPQTRVSNKTKVALGVGITVGLGFGLTTLAAAAFYYWKRRKRSENVGIERARSEWHTESRESRFSRFSLFRAL